MAGEPLTEAQRDELSKLLSSPLLFPHEFVSWLPQFLGQNLPYLPISQIQGHQLFQPKLEIVNTEESTTATGVWGDLFSTEGPRINNVSAGDFLAVWGYYQARGGGSGSAKVEGGVSVDGNDPTLYIEPPSTTDQASFHWRAGRIQVTGDANHFVKLKYRATTGGAGTGVVAHRWLALIRVR